MSLTSHLKDHSSPIGTFIHTKLSHSSSISRVANPQLRNAQRILPPSQQTYPYSLIGMAVDYRLRYYFALTQEDELVASEGAADLVTKMPQYPVQLLERFFADLSATVESIQPVGRLLVQDAESLLARYCFVLALFETIYRSGIVPELLFLPSVKTTVDELLATAEESWVEDICAVSRLFYRTQNHLLAKPFTLNPTFTGSADVGGADADMIVDGCLLEIKTSVKKGLDPAWLLQLAGYLLLDYDDEYAIQSVGIYMARHGILFSWPVAEYLQLLTGDDNLSLTSLRQQFREEFGLYSRVPPDMELPRAHGRTLELVTQIEQIRQYSHDECCNQCGELLEIVEERSVENTTKRGRIRLTDIITIRCVRCNASMTFHYDHPKSPKTDLDKLMQSRRVACILGFNNAYAMLQRFQL